MTTDISYYECIKMSFIFKCKISHYFMLEVKPRRYDLTLTLNSKTNNESIILAKISLNVHQERPLHHHVPLTLVFQSRCLAYVMCSIAAHFWSQISHIWNESVTDGLQRCRYSCRLQLWSIFLKRIARHSLALVNETIHWLWSDGATRPSNCASSLFWKQDLASLSFVPKWAPAEGNMEVLFLATWKKVI